MKCNYRYIRQSQTILLWTLITRAIIAKAGFIILMRILDILDPLPTILYKELKMGFASLGWSSLGKTGPLVLTMTLSHILKTSGTFFPNILDL